MLVLTRKVGERIQIGDRVLVTVLHVQGDKVRLGFVAPSDVTVLREELNGRARGELAPTLTNPNTV